MIRTLFTAISLTTCLAVVPAALAADLTVTIQDVPSGSGTVRAALYGSADAFPGGQPVAQTTVQAQAGTVTLTFKGIEPGRYAVAAYHDEDGNEEMATNLVGFPTEAFGFSRNARGSFGPAKFADAAFDLEEGSWAIEFKLND